MTAAPSIAILLLVGVLSAIGSAVLRRPWQQRLAVSFAVLEFSMAAGLIALVFLY